MHVAVIFGNVGSYHAARLRAAHSSALERNWRFSAVQVTDSSLQHPWGDLRHELTFPLETILSLADATPESAERAMNSIDRRLVTAALDRLEPDVVAIPGWGFRAARAALGWCRARGAAALLMSESKRDDEARHWWKEHVKRWLYVRHFKAALVGGTIHRDYLVELGICASRIFTGYDVVDNCHFARGSADARRNPDAARREHPAIPQRPYLISVTRFLPRKDVATLIRAYAAYRAAVSSGDTPWDLVVCGSGPERNRIEQIVHELGLVTHVHLPGFVEYQALGAWYGLAEALVHTAEQEPWGLVINEACAARLPIVCSRAVGARYELVRDGENGWLFDPRDVRGLAAVLESLHGTEPEQRHARGEVSARLVDRFRPEHFANGLFAAADALHAGGPAGS